MSGKAPQPLASAIEAHPGGCVNLIALGAEVE
jgi:hypothetical protein